MKNIIVLFLSCCFLIGNAQNNFQFADTSAIWIQCSSTFWEGSHGTDRETTIDTFKANGYTVIDGIYYQKIVVNSEWTLQPSYLFLLRRDSTGKIFLYENSEERLIYDFSLDVNDTLEIQSIDMGLPQIAKYIVDSTDTVIYGYPRKRMYIRCVENCCFFNQTDTIIDGIGSLKSVFVSPYTYECSYMPGASFSLKSYMENNSLYQFVSSCHATVGLISPKVLNPKVYPCPFSNKLFIESMSIKAKSLIINVTDVLGKNVYTLQLQREQDKTIINTTDWKSGVYFISIVNGTELWIEKLIKI